MNTYIVLRIYRDLGLVPPSEKKSFTTHIRLCTEPILKFCFGAVFSVFSICPNKSRIWQKGKVLLDYMVSH